MRYDHDHRFYGFFPPSLIENGFKNTGLEFKTFIWANIPLIQFEAISQKLEITKIR